MPILRINQLHEIYLQCGLMNSESTFKDLIDFIRFIKLNKKWKIRKAARGRVPKALFQ